MRMRLPVAIAFLLALAPTLAHSQVAEKIVDIPTRPGVTQRAVLLAPQAPKATVILFAGGHGGLQIGSSGAFGWGEGNFLVRTRRLFAEQGLLTIVVDAPSDRQKPPYLGGFRQTPDHVADIKALIAWARQQANVPVWLVGTSRGTQSAAFVATQLSGADAPDGLVLTSTMLSDDAGRPVPAMPLDRVKIPVLVVHHEQDGCRHCAFSQIPSLMDKLGGAPKTQMIAFKGGQTRGDPCEAFAYHGFNGIERDVVAQIAGWITGK
ncbi:MAG: lysophospholipase [Burkholderiales bacterium]|nr:lysophospholipase [Burkholderiales bacterium]